MAAWLLRFSCPAILALLGAAPAFAQPPAALPPIKAVDYDPHGAIRVNGQPFFPIVLYDAPHDAETLRGLQGFGFNVLTCDAKLCASLPAQGFYGACHADKKLDDLSGALFGVGIDSPALYFKQNLLKQTAEANAKTLAAVPGRPIMNAIGYWEDEPTGVFEGKLPSKAVYDDLVAAIDVSAPYLYPVPYQPISSVGDAVARARRASGHKKPVLPVLQLFVWDVKDRYPTPDELRCMAFLSLVEGAQGIGYYSYGYVAGQTQTNIAAAQPELWKSVKNLNRDLADIGPRLLAAEATDELTLGKGAPAVRMKVVREKDALLAVVVNSAATRQDATLVCASGTIGQLVLPDGSRSEVQKKSLDLPLEPFRVKVLRLTTAP